MNNEYYSGPDGLRDYLCPSAERMIPLVELPGVLNPYLATHDIHIDVKLMNSLPLLSVKSLPAWQMLVNGAVAGKSIVEASSGNTVMSLGLLAQHFDAGPVRAIASPEVSAGKLALLRLAGVTVELVKGPICPNPDDPDGAIAVARRQGALPGVVNLGQYDNDANPLVHERITGPQLYAQLGDQLGMFVAGLGTTGTLLGTARYLRRTLPAVRVAGVVRTPNNAVPGVRTVNGLREVAFGWRDVIDDPLVEVGEMEAYDASLAMIRQGILVGPSAGFALAGTLRHLRQLADAGTLDQLRGKHVVFVAPDTPLPYVDDYERVLGSDRFPAIENAHLLPQKLTTRTDAPEVSIHDLYNRLQVHHAETMLLIDVREPNEFADHRIDGSENVPLDALPSWIRSHDMADRREILFVCRSGNRSARATQLATAMGLVARNVTGGTTAWSAAGYPRQVSPLCPPGAPLA